jgi:hypothetical protein
MAVTTGGSSDIYVGMTTDTKEPNRTSVSTEILTRHLSRKKLEVLLVEYEAQPRLCQDERRKIPKILWVKTRSDFEEMLPMRDIRLPPRSR